MTTIQIQLPDSLFQQVRDLAAQEQMSVDDLAAQALTDRVTSAAELAYFRERAERGSREKFLRAMSKVPSVPPIPPDQQPPTS